jgi:ankyrin repeat protein
VANEGHIDVANLLLSYHADVNARNNNGKTALYLAAIQNLKAVAHLLRQHGGHE